MESEKNYFFADLFNLNYDVELDDLSEEQENEYHKFLKTLID